MASFGGILNGIGAGLGQYAEYALRQRQQENEQAGRQLQQLLQGLQISDLMQKDKIKSGAAGAVAGLLGGGGGGFQPGGPTPSAGRGFLSGPGASPAPQMPQALPSPPSARGSVAMDSPDNIFAPGGGPSNPLAVAGGAPRVAAQPSAAPAPQPTPPPAAQPQPAPQQDGQIPGVPPAPPEYDPVYVAQELKRQHPQMDDPTLVEAVNMVGEYLGPKAKAAYDRWKTQAEMMLRAQGQGETTRHDLATEGQAGQRLGIEQAGQTETERSHRVGEAETERSHKAAESGREQKFQAGLAQKQQKTQAEITQMKSLADRARRLYQAVEENPKLVGAKGLLSRTVGGIGEQLGVIKEDPAVADFASQIQILQAQLQRPLLGARYFSARAQEQMSKLVPALNRMDNPTAVKSALRNLAETLEGTAESAETATRAAQTDYQHMSDEELLRGLGITGAPQQ